MLGTCSAIDENRHMTIDEVCRLLSQYPAWLPRKGVGSFLTIEFGPPHLVVREPLTKPGVRERLRRRRVDVKGEVHLWVKADHWTLQAADWSITSNDGEREITRKLDVLSGQKIIQILVEQDKTLLVFEYGERLIIDIDPVPDQVQWTVFIHGHGNVSLLDDRSLRMEVPR